MFAITLPKSGLTMSEAKVVEWLKKEGDDVEKGEPLFTVETEKVAITTDSPASGKLLKIVAQIGATIPVGATVGYIGMVGEGAEFANTVSTPLKQETHETPETEEGQPNSSTSSSVQSGPIRATPRARRIAAERGIELSTILGTGPSGLVTEKDVLSDMGTSDQSNQGLKVMRKVPFSERRSIIASRLHSSRQTAVDVTLMSECDASYLVSLRDVLAHREGSQTPTYSVLLVKVVSEALKEHRVINSVLENSEIKYIYDINIGIAVATESGLVVPVIKNADLKNILTVSEEFSHLTNKARSDKLEQTDVTGGTFTISNLGMYHTDFFTPVINPPQVAILGVGRITNKPVAEGDRIVIKPVISFSLTFDHRVVDGDTAAKFLQAIELIATDAHRLDQIFK